MPGRHASVGLRKNRATLLRVWPRKRPEGINFHRLRGRYWKDFDVEKFVADWQRGVGKPIVPGD